MVYVREEHNYMKMKQHNTPDTTYLYKIYQSIINIWANIVGSC